MRLHHRYRHLTAAGKRPTVTTVAIARELSAFIWADMTNQPLARHDRQEATA